MPDNTANNSCAVAVVLYHATADNLVATLAAEPGVSVILVDNTPGRRLDASRWEHRDLQYIPLGENLGIGAAHNAAVRAARGRGAGMVVFFDQDSEPAPGYVRAICAEYRRIEALHPNLFLLGPSHTDGHTGREVSSVFHPDNGSDGFVPRREIICSGSCASLDKIDAVGPEDGSLFIDYVDFEWCWRANAQGYVSGKTERVGLLHRVGQSNFGFMGQRIILSSPARYYYQYRNYARLLRRSYVPRQWKVAAGVKNTLYPLLYPWHAKDWKSIWRNAARGLRDGLMKGSEEA